MNNLHPRVKNAIDQLHPHLQNGIRYLLPIKVAADKIVSGIHLDTFKEEDVVRHLKRNISYLEDLRFYCKKYLHVSL